MKRASFVLSFIVVLAFSCNGKSDNNKIEAGKETPDGPTTTTENLIANWDFEQDVDLNTYTKAVEGEWRWVPSWDDQGTKGAVAEPYQDNTRGVNGSRCIAILAPQNNVDVGFQQVIRGLKPGEPYKVSARVKTEGVSTGGAGAHISLDYLWAPRSNAITGDHSEWTTTVLEFEPATDTVVICLKLGNTAADARGVAYFDNVTMSYNYDLYQRTSPGGHIKLVINKSYLSVSDAVIDKWLGRLDQVYESYKEFFWGETPYDGNTIKIRSGSINAWAYAGNPIQWNQNYIAEALTQIAEQDDWCFGIMHELGHDYNPGHFTQYKNATNAWNFNEELFANFRMYYALTHVEGAQVYQDQTIYNADGTKTSTKRIYKGDEIKQLYKSWCDNSYDKTIGANNASEMGNALCYCMIRIAEKYGWDLWQRTFKYLYNIPSSSVSTTGWTQWEKFQYLMKALSKNTTDGSDVTETCFTTQELTIIEKYLSTQS